MNVEKNKLNAKISKKVISRYLAKTNLFKVKFTFAKIATYLD